MNLIHLDGDTLLVYSADEIVTKDGEVFFLGKSGELLDLNIPDGHDQQLAELLTKLADNDSVREYLASCGVKGECGGAEDCPVAIWLSDHLGGVTVLVTSSKCWIPGRGAVDTPPAVANFIAAFDSGSYPELELPA